MNSIPSSTRVVHVADAIPDAIYVGRANPRKRLKASPLANPFKVTNAQPRDVAISKYAVYLNNEIHKGNVEIIEALISCRSLPLACWCRHDGAPWTQETACHADLIIEWLKRYSDDELRGMIARPLPARRRQDGETP